MDDDIKLTEEDYALDDMIDKIAEKQKYNEHKDNKITRELIENNIDDIRRFSFLIHDNTFDKDIINERVPGIIGIYSSSDNSVQKVFKAKINQQYGQGIINDDEYMEVILSPTQLTEAFILNNKVKYRTADYLEKVLMDEHPECFKFKKQNYINPAEIADPAARNIMSLDIKVNNHMELEDNFLDIAIDPIKDPTKGIKWIDQDVIYQHEGSYCGKKTEICIFLCLTYESLNKKTIITPDCLVQCFDSTNNQLMSMGVFNLKTGYDKKNNQWKSDYGSITRKIKKILQDEHMTDFKQQNSNRSMNANK